MNKKKVSFFLPGTHLLSLRTVDYKKVKNFSKLYFSSKK
jgi:hypothetical protein